MPDNNAVPLDASPSDRMAAAIAHFGEPVVADRAAALLGGANEGEEFLLWVGGRHAQGILDGAPPLYWPEVWGARALLSAWDDSAAEPVRAGLLNQAWRVREMCCRVVTQRALPFGDEVVILLTDDHARVRAAAARAIGVVGDYEQGLVLRRLLKDPEVEVRRAAGDSLRELARRLGRTIE
ncbi:MAG TPA: HEAT repeat domain-containing protein [Galbitalea sp.]